MKKKKTALKKKKKKNKKIKFTVKQTITFGVLLITMGIGLILYKYYKYERAEVFDKLSVSISEIEEIEESGQTEEEKQKQNQDDISKYYIGKLEIPKISFSRGFAAMGDSHNDVDRTIQIMPESSYPDVKGGNFIIVGHSGNGWNSFFKDLYKLEVNDTAVVYYNNKKYTYKIADIYNVPKTGEVKIVRQKGKTTLTLITCTKGDKTAQTVYILYLKNEE